MEKILFVCMYVCLLACLLVSVGLRARIAGQNVRVSVLEQLLTPSQQVTGSIPGNDMLFFSKIFFRISAMYTHARHLSAYYYALHVLLQ